jgi:hypothetical protein
MPGVGAIGAAVQGGPAHAVESAAVGDSVE